MNSYDHIKQNAETILKRIQLLNSAVRLVAVSKTFDKGAIETAARCGLTEFGESRIQEAQEKIPELKAGFSFLKWHMIGHLQTNKAAKAAGLFEMIQSVDSYRIAEKISAARGDNAMDILLEIKVSNEEAKFGIAPKDAAQEAEKIGSLPGVRIKGLMAIAPYFDDPGLSAPYFRKARRVFEELKAASGASMEILSMGMSGDYEIAIQEGANMVRVGTGIFGRR